MLNKKICKQCCNRFWPAFENYIGPGWDEDDDIRWKEGYVLCPNIDTTDQDIKNKPSDQCPYQLEHLLKAQRRVK